MRHVNYSLKPATIDTAKPRDKPYSLTDGGGLFVEVLVSGAKVWRYKYHLAGKREKVTIGTYPAVGIKAARDRHEELRELLERGESPARAKQTKVVELERAAAAAITFQAFAAQWIDETLFYRSATYRAQITRWLDAHVYPRIGDKALGDVEPADVLAIIQPLVATPTTADRVRVIVQQVYNFAIRKLLVKTNPATPLRGAVVVPPKTHHKHLVGKQIGAFWRCLGQQGAHATTIAAARLLLLTMSRKNELLRSRWSEFDLDGRVWDVPEERMKAKRPHRVYLSRQALALLIEVRLLTGPRADDLPPGDGYVFPSIFRRSVPMGDVTLNHLFSRLDFGVSGFSPHGTRGTAATLLRERGVGKDVVELLLAHAEKDAVAASYSHHELADDRAAALQLLADEVDKLAAGAEVIPLRVA
jgi:integrase